MSSGSREEYSPPGYSILFLYFSVHRVSVVSLFGQSGLGGSSLRKSFSPSRYVYLKTALRTPGFQVSRFHNTGFYLSTDRFQARLSQMLALAKEGKVNSRCRLPEDWACVSPSTQTWTRGYVGGLARLLPGRQFERLRLEDSAKDCSTANR